MGFVGYRETDMEKQPVAGGCDFFLFKMWNAETRALVDERSRREKFVEYLWFL